MPTPVVFAKPVSTPVVTSPEPTDEALAARATGGDRAAFELLMRRHNRRVYRVVRTVLRDAAEIEDAMQQAYVQAFTHLAQFQGASAWSTWLCRIAFNEALARVRGRRRFVSIDTGSEDPVEHSSKAPGPDPEREASARELGHIIEGELDRLPEMYRAVVMLREIEGLDTRDTAAILDVEEPVVKTRLHRARALLRAAVERRVGESLEAVFEFGAERCDRVVAAVLSGLPPSR
ncbi:MAG: polymerase sigma-54 factor RpoN [Myxococcales bacterium]|jgi:RNA polymerase sigma-70 factor (ECF subfamily)|nr:polymerase sigma-54 factor RpoN [Myxococcales bacterium]